MARLKSLEGLITPCLKIIYTNTDQFTVTKKEELLRRIESEKPGIVAICEAKPKSGTDRALVEYDIPNFDLHPVNLDNTIGRGIAIYTHKSIAKSTIQISNDSNFEEAGLLEIRLRGGDLFLFACCYRSPTETELSALNNKKLNNLLKFVSSKRYTHICIVGDFNYRTINWQLLNTSKSMESDEYVFLETFQDCFLHQQVKYATRRRGETTPSLIDLVLTNKDTQVNDVKHLPPLGKSDHDVLSFEFQCYMELPTTRETYLYSKGNFIDMKKDMESNWIKSFGRTLQKYGT